MASAVRVDQAHVNRYQLGLLATLYLSQGLPFGFFSQALPVILRQQGFSLGKIGLTSLLALPWAAKFAWAPFVDRMHLFPKWSGGSRHKSWLLPLQAALVMLLVVLALLGPPEAAGGALGLRLLLGAVFVTNLLCATQDIVTDALAVELLPYESRGLANGVQVAGYRAGMILGGGALLVVLEKTSWMVGLLSMAGVLLVATIPVWLSKRLPQGSAAAPSRAGERTSAAEGQGATTVTLAGATLEGDALRPTIAGFLRRPGMVGLIALVFTYKFGDALGTAMLRPFLVDKGLSLGDLGWLLGTGGFSAGLAGALVGGAISGRTQRPGNLVGFGLLQSLALAGYAYLATITPIGGLAHGGTSLAVWAVCMLEHFTGGMATAALFTCMMDWCREKAAATDYAIQASLQVMSSGIAASSSGWLAEHLGYATHFSVAAIISAASLLTLISFRRSRPSAQSA